MVVLPTDKAEVVIAAAGEFFRSQSPIWLTRFRVNLIAGYGWSSCCGGGDGEGVLIRGGLDLGCRRLAHESIPLFITAVHFSFGLSFPVQCVVTSGYLNHFAECVRFTHKSDFIFQSVREAVVELEAEGGVSPGYSG